MGLSAMRQWTYSSLLPPTGAEGGYGGGWGGRTTVTVCKVAAERTSKPIKSEAAAESTIKGRSMPTMVTACAPLSAVMVKVSSTLDADAPTKTADDGTCVAWATVPASCDRRSGPKSSTLPDTDI
eukprot:7380058-Prymnesium_polylepis.1